MSRPARRPSAGRLAQADPNPTRTPRSTRKQCRPSTRLGPFRPSRDEIRHPNRPRNARTPRTPAFAGVPGVELAGLEPATSWVRSCARPELRLFAGFPRRRTSGLTPSLSASVRPFRLGSSQRNGSLARSPICPLRLAGLADPLHTPAVTRVTGRVRTHPAPRPGQERRSWRPARSLAREGGRRVMSPVVAPSSGISSGGCCATRGTGSTGKGTRMQAERPQGVPFRT
jgi:hypothetical protein